MSLYNHIQKTLNSIPFLLYIIEHAAILNMHAFLKAHVGKKCPPLIALPDYFPILFSYKY